MRYMHLDVDTPHPHFPCATHTHTHGSCLAASAAALAAPVAMRDAQVAPPQRNVSVNLLAPAPLNQAQVLRPQTTGGNNHGVERRNGELGVVSQVGAAVVSVTHVFARGSRA